MERKSGVVFGALNVRALTLNMTSGTLVKVNFIFEVKQLIYNDKFKLCENLIN